MVSKAILAKITHMYGRHYGGYFTPTEIVALTGEAIYYNQRDVDRAKQLMKCGRCLLIAFYFDVKSNSPIDKAIRAIK